MEVLRAGGGSRTGTDEAWEPGSPQNAERHKRAALSPKSKTKIPAVGLGKKQGRATPGPERDESPIKIVHYRPEQVRSHCFYGEGMSN